MDIRQLEAFVYTVKYQSFSLAAQKLYLEDNSLCFVIPTVKTVAGMVRQMVGGSGLPITIVEDEDDRHNAFKASAAAMAASGTVALELAIAGVPHIIGYKVSPLTAVLVRKFMHIQFVNLSNIMLGREVVPELLQEQCVPGNICRYIKRFLAKDDIFERQTEGFQKVRAKCPVLCTLCAKGGIFVCLYSSSPVIFCRASACSCSSELTFTLFVLCFWKCFAPFASR